MLVESGGTVGDFVAPQPVSPAAIPHTAGRVSFGEVWQLVTAPGTLRFEVPASSAARRRLALQLTTLPPGANVILSCAALGSRGRSRRLAREAGIELLREYVAIPSIDPPTCYVEDTPADRTRRVNADHSVRVRDGGAKEDDVAAPNWCPLG